MIYRIEIGKKQGREDPGGDSVAARVADYLGLKVERIRIIDVYTVRTSLEKKYLEKFASAVTDTVINEYSMDEPLARGFDWLVEVGFRPGVTDNVGRTATETLQLMAPDCKDTRVYTSRQYAIKGELFSSDVSRITTELLSNPLIHHYKILSRFSFEKGERMEKSVPRVLKDESATSTEMVDLHISDRELLKMSKVHTWALSSRELAVIRDHFDEVEVKKLRAMRGLDGGITELELEVLAQTWSEHCKHKIFNARIAYTDTDGSKVEIDSLFKTYIVAATENIRARMGNSDYCKSVFVDNAGVWEFDRDWNLVFKVETHNSPSALDPYGGALTGIVGVNRDPLGTGMGSKLFCNTNVFCLASPFYKKEIPPRLLHPRRVMDGVREGVEHGGNKSGIPTVNGSLVFDERFLGKPLIFCGTGGLMPAALNGKPSYKKAARPSDRIVMIGGKIGKDGIHGATFSSEELHEGSPVTAVQIGDPITQKRMVDFILIARDKNLYTAITDNGAGGLSSSVGEMAQDAGGAKIDLELAPLKYPGLKPWEIFLSEAQERMTVAVEPDKLKSFIMLANEMGVEATDLGEFTKGPNLEIYYAGEVAGIIDMNFLHNGLPQMNLTARWKKPEVRQSSFSEPENLEDALFAALGHLDVCSKEYWVRQYDHEVQGGSVVKPLVGALCDGPSDAAVVRPVLQSMRAVAIGHGICPRRSDVDTYAMAACAADEAMRNIVAVGADPEKVVALDNFCWPDSVQSPTCTDGHFKLAQLVRANMALAEVCKSYMMPLVSGKDSMKNDYSIGKTRISIPPTLLVTAVGILEDANMAVTMDAKRAGDAVYVIGKVFDELGAGVYADYLGQKNLVVPCLHSPDETFESYKWLHRAQKSGLVSSCHDISDGGLAVALSETAFAGEKGMTVELSNIPGDNIKRDDIILFSESCGRFVVTVKEEFVRSFEIIMDGLASRIGHTTDDPRLVIIGLNGKSVIDTDIFRLKNCWKTPLDF